MLELAIPFLGSLAVFFLFRRLDSANVNLRKLKNIMEKGQRDIQEITQKKKEELKDATTRFDLLVINANKYLDTLKKQLEEARSSFAAVESSRTNLKEMDIELQNLEGRNRNIIDQLKFINDSLDRIDQHQKKIKRIQEHLHQVDHDAGRMVSAFQEALRDKSSEILVTLEKKIAEIAQETREYQNSLREELLEKQRQVAESLDESYADLEHALKESARELTHNLEDRISKQVSAVNDLAAKVAGSEEMLRVTLPSLISEIKEDLANDIAQQQQKLEALRNGLVQADEGIRKKLSQFREEIETQRTLLFKELLEETDRIRENIKTLDLDAIEKRDEIVRASRMEAQKIRENIDSFQEIYQKARETLYVEASRREAELIKRIEELEESSKDVIEQLNNTKHSSLQTVQQALQETLRDIRSQSTRAFQEAYREFSEEEARMRTGIESLRRELDTVVNGAERKIQSLTNRADEIIEKIEHEFEDYLSRLKTEAGSITGDFEDQLNEKLLTVTAQISGLEGDLHNLREHSAEDLERRMSQAFAKIAGFEKSLSEVQNQLSRKWQEDADRIMSAIRDQQDDFDKMAETWHARLESLIAETKDQMHKSTVEWERNKASMLSSFEEELDERLARMSSRSEEIAEESENRLHRMVTDFRMKIQEREDEIFSRTEGMIQRFTEMKKNLEVRQESLVESLYAEKKKIESELKETSNKQLELFMVEMEDGVDRLSQQLREVAQAAYGDLRNRTEAVLADFSAIKAEIDNTLELFRDNQQGVLNAIIEETKRSGNDIRELQNAMKELKAESLTIEKVRSSYESIRKAREELSAQLAQVDEKNLTLNEMFRKIEELRDMRLKLDAEITLMSQKREKVDRLDEQLSMVVALKTQIDEKEADLQRIRQNISEIFEGYRELEVQKNKVDGLLDEFMDQQRLVRNVIDSIGHHEKSSMEIRDAIEKLSGNLQRLDAKSASLREEIDKLEHQMISIRRNEEQIQMVNRKFLEIEDLLDDIEKKKQQLEHIRQRYEELRNTMSSNVREIEEIEHNAEAKVKQLSDFVNAVGGTVMASGEPTISKKMTPLKPNDQKDTVLKLGQFGWTAEEIGQHINMELATIKTILATYGDKGSAGRS